MVTGQKETRFYLPISYKRIQWVDKEDTRVG